MAELAAVRFPCPPDTETLEYLPDARSRWFARYGDHAEGLAPAGSCASKGLTAPRRLPV